MRAIALLVAIAAAVYALLFAKPWWDAVAVKTKCRLYIILIMASVTTILLFIAENT